MKILLAEDDRISQRMLEGLLSKWGYEVVTASDGHEAWRILQTAEAPSLAILDWTMPGLTGLEICERVRQALTRTPPHLILLTARTGNQDLVTGLTAGANDFIRKPFDPQELQARINVGRTVVELQSHVAKRMQEFEDYVEDSPLGIILVEQDGSISFANDRAATIFGYESGTLEGEAIEILVPDALRAHHVQLREAFMQKPQSRMMSGRNTLLGQKRDGTMIPVAIGLNRIPRHEATRIACTILDLTDLRTAEERLDEFFELSLDFFCIANVSGYLLKFNSNFSRLLDYSDEELKSRPLYDFFHPEDVPAIKAAVARLADGQLVIDFRCRARSRKGIDCWIEWSARSIPKSGMIYSVGRNMTERLRAEDELRYRQNREYALLNHTPAIVCIKDLQGQYEFVNDQHVKRFSGSAETAIGKTARDFFTEQDAIRIEQQEQWIIQTGDTVTITEISNEPDGQHTYLSVAFPLKDPHGQTCATARVSTDVTKQLQALEREREVKTALAFQQHLYPNHRLTLSGLDVAGAVQPATGLCGDYYDYFELSSQRLMVAIGDVSGHGIGPALQMTKVSSTARVLARMGMSLPDIVGELNRELCESLPEGSFVSLFMAEINLSEGTIAYIGAGHESILVRSNGSVCRLTSTHPVLGVFSSFKSLQTTSIAIHPGDILLLLTDGVTESMNSTQMLFGMPRVGEIVSQHRHLTSQKIIDALLMAVEEFVGGRIQKDDTTVVAVKRFQ